VETLSKRGYRFIHSVEPTPPRTPPGKEGDPHSDAHVACAIGRYLWNRRNVADLWSSIRYFDLAIEAERLCGSAYAGLADANAVLGIWGLQSPDRAFDGARRAAIRALELEPNLADAHTSLAEVVKDYDWNWTLAERHYRHALALKPGYATAHQWYAQLLATLGRYPEAVWHIEQARRADPVSPAINAYLPNIFLAARQYDRALCEAQRAVGLEPYSPLAHLQLGRAYLFSDHGQQAVAALQHAAALAASASMWDAELCFAYARAGDCAAATRLLSGLVDRARHDYVSPYDLAVACSGIGDRGAAVDYLEQAVDQRVMRVLGVGDPEFDDLRSDPRLVRLIDRLRLPRLPSCV
jgi:Tfp pilus assembly protein PilF